MLGTTVQEPCLRLHFDASQASVIEVLDLKGRAPLHASEAVSQEWRSILYFLGTKPSSRPRKETNMLIRKKKKRGGGEEEDSFISCIASRKKCHLSSSFSLSFLGISLPSFPLSFWRIRNSHASISLALMCPRGIEMTRGHPGLSCKGHIRPRAGLIQSVSISEDTWDDNHGCPYASPRHWESMYWLLQSQKGLTLLMVVKKHGQDPVSVSERQDREPREAFPHQKFLQGSRCCGM